MSCSGEDMKNTETRPLSRLSVSNPISVEYIIEYEDPEHEEKVRHPLGSDEEYAISMVQQYRDTLNTEHIKLFCVTKLEQEIVIPE